MLHTPIEVYVEWQGDLHQTLAGTEGFLSLEIISSQSSDKLKWKISIRFQSENACINWKQSQSFSDVIAKIQPLLATGHGLKITEENIDDETFSEKRVTELFVTHIQPGKETEFRAWIAKIHQAEAKFPGFRGVYIQSPTSSDTNKHWITFLQFDSQKHLDFWLTSPERKEIVDQSKALLASLESHRVITSFPGWFNNIVLLYAIEVWIFA